MRLSRLAYRQVARLLPRDLRDESGTGLEDAALAWLARARAERGRLGLAAAWMRLAVDAVGTAIAARRDRYVTLEPDPLERDGRQGVSEAMMDNFRKDLSYTARTLWRQPAFTLITIATLALGIGANTAVFSVINGVILRPLPYPEPDRLQFITSQFPNIGFDQFWISPPEFVEYRDRNQVFESVGAYATGAVNLGGESPSRPVLGQVTPELMPTLGVPPLLGRWFTPEDAVPNAPPVVILSAELWQRSFGGRQDILGQTVDINNRAIEVIGVMPPGFDVHDQRVEIWAPLTINPATLANQRGSHGLYLIGRLKPGITLAQARADLEVRLEQWPTEVTQGHVPNTTTHRFRIDPLKDDIVGSVRTALLVLQGAVAFVLLIACANLASLLIARADSRLREYAVRTALGASRWRLLGQLMTEGLVLAVLAAGAGVALAWAGLRALLSVNPDAIPRSTEIALDWNVLGFTLAAAIGTGLVFGLVPLLHLGRSVGQSMKDAASRSATGGVGRARVRAALVVAEVALAVLLVVGAGLLIRSFVNLMQVDMGFDRSSLSTFGVVMPAPQYTAERRLAFLDQLATRIGALPGVTGVAAASGLPPLRPVNANDTDFEHIVTPPAGSAVPQGPVENVDYYQFVTLNYVTTMGIPVLEGRAFELADVGGAPVVMINQALARKFYADRSPIGQRLKPGYGPFAQVPWFTVIGVLKDVKQGGVAEPVGTELYGLVEQLPSVIGFAPGAMNLMVRAEVPFEGLAPLFRRSVAELDPSLPLIRMRSMENVVGDAVARPRFLTMLLGVFAGLALLLAAVGTYGILSYLVAERRQEIGIRMALGADRRSILSMVMTRGLVLSGAGLVLGLAASVGLTRLLETMLFNVEPIDPPTLAAVAVTMTLVAAAACFAPAWRATRTDPLIVLKND